MIRISSNYMVQRYQKDLNELDYTKSKLMEQGDGKKLHRPSDNSVDYSRYLRYNVSEGENNRYQDSVKAGISWMNSTQTALSGIEDIQKTFKAKTIQGANDDKDENSGDWPAIAREMKAGIQQIISLGNTQLGDRYIFSGQADLRQPFSISDENVPRHRGLAKTLDDRQAAFFNDASNTDSANFLHQMLSLDGSDGKSYYLNTLTGDIYTKEFVQEGYKDVIASGRSTVSSADRVGNITTGTNFIKDNFKNTGEIIDDPAASPGHGANWSDTAAVAGVTLKFSTVRQQIVSYNGDFRYISMVKQNGSTEPTADTVNKTGLDIFGRDLFDDKNSGNEPSGTAMVNSMLTVYAKTNSADPHWLSSDGISLADAANQVTLQAHTETGARTQLYKNMTDILTDHGENITRDITNVSSTDVAELAMKMMQQQTVMSMSLSMGARILPLSLVDYLR
ncbi:flagellar hook-associated protein FlgL [uncultured Selenomonas sp.]|uniref:flagellar hook-associated protein FlgL n=1 Tax=uncultured Selenomonas sp. TaxID=159275 RepID=UPI0028D87355|nr:flagellar hook-associated protein FlgL [uncultured Selenomonas sp.]